MNASSALSPSDHLLQLLRSDPANVSLLQECVRVALAEQRPDKARESLDLAQHSGLSPSVFRYASAQVLLHEHRWAEAIAVLNELLELDGPALPPTDLAAALFALGFALFSEQHHVQAAAVLERALLTGVAPPGSLAYLLRSLHHSGNPKAACEAWSNSSAQDRTPEAAGIASLAYFDTRQHEQAASLARDCLERSPDCVEALVVHAAEGMLRGGAESAVPLLERAVGLNQRDGRVWSTLATARMAQGDLDSALQAYDRATETLTDHIGTWSGMAWAYLIKKDFDAARRCFDRAMAIDDRFGETHGGLAVLEALQGHREEAERFVVTARRLDPKGFAWRYAEALLSGNAKDAESVQRLAQRLLASSGYLELHGPRRTLH